MAINAGADALGLVARMPSGPGQITDRQIAAVAAIVPPPVATFLLTAETRAQDISNHIRVTRPTTVQIVCHISPVEAARLVELEPRTRRVQVIHVEGWDALDKIATYGPYVHAFLLDSGRPSAAVAELGGTGRSHDWAISAAFVKASPLPVFLAGGLTSGNVANAIQQVRPFGVDLCSGIRTNGALDPAKLRSFVLAVERTDAEFSAC